MHNIHSAKQSRAKVKPITNEQEAALFKRPFRAQETNAAHGCRVELQAFSHAAACRLIQSHLDSEERLAGSEERLAGSEERLLGFEERLGDSQERELGSQERFSRASLRYM